jgi:cadmium resistance protein CadD (predicted permease)
VQYTQNSALLIALCVAILQAQKFKDLAVLKNKTLRHNYFGHQIGSVDTIMVSLLRSVSGKYLANRRPRVQRKGAVGINYQHRQMAHTQNIKCAGGC